MKYRSFGKTDFNVSALGLGCMRLPTKPFLPQKVDTTKAIQLIRNAVDQGVNYLDTAWPYHLGASEKVVGEALKNGYREKVHLVTKLFMPLARKTEDFDKMLDKQLEKLQTDYLDTYLFHALNKKAFEKVKRLNLIDRMIAAKEAGKIRHIGFSFHDVLPVFKEIVDYFDWDVVQIQYNYMDTAIQASEEGLKYAAAKNMAIVIMEPVKGGQLANPPKEAINVMNKAAIKRTAVDWALQYLWDRPEISVVLSGMSNQKQLDENVASASISGINSLTDVDQQTIQQLVDIYRKNILVPCTACRYCMDCPSGVDIPRNFAILNNVSTGRGGFFGWLIKQSYKKLANSPKKLNTDKNNGNATICTDCGICLPKCPQSIYIPNELKKVEQILGKGKKIRDVYPPDHN